MSYQFVETFDSRDATDSTDSSSSVDLSWFVTSDTDAEARDDLAIKAAIGATAPVAYDGLVLRSIKHERLGPRVGKVSIRYVDPEKKQEDEKQETGEFRFSFDTTGGSQHVTQSKETISRTPAPGGVAPDFKGAIGVGRDNQVAGVDLIIPALRFSLTYKIPRANLTLEFARFVAQMTGRTNNATFQGFEAGELLFAGGTGEQSTAGDPELTYSFEASQNVNNLDVGDIVVPVKKGHDYLWVAYAETDDDDAKQLVAQPAAAYVERVYDSFNFNDLFPT